MAPLLYPWARRVRLSGVRVVPGNLVSESPPVLGSATAAPVAGARARRHPMSVSPSYKTFVLEQLSGAGTVTARAMFGGVGLYCQGLFFGLIDDDTLYLKVDDATRPEFERLGSQPFRPYGDDSQVMQYYALPADLLE